MTIALVTYDYKGALNGAATVTWNMLKVLKHTEHIQIKRPATILPFGAIPEAVDAHAYDDLAKIDWFRYDCVVTPEYGFLQFFVLRRIPLILQTHTAWSWPDSTAPLLKIFRDFPDRFLVMTEDMAQHMELSKARGVYDVVPFPIDGSELPPPRVPKKKFVLWGGRDDIHKDPALLSRIARAMPDVTFKCYSTTQMSVPMPPNVQVRCRRSRIEFLVAMHEAQVYLCTSQYESYCLVLMEAGLSGCHVVCRDVQGVEHARDVAMMFHSTVEAIAHINTALHSPQADPVPWKRYTTEAVASLWLDWESRMLAWVVEGCP